MATILQQSLSFGNGYVVKAFVEPSLSVVLPLRSHHFIWLVILLKRPTMLSLLAATFPEDIVF